MKILIFLLSISIITTACGFFGLLPDIGGGHAKIEQYNRDLEVITAKADSSSAVVDSALWRTKGFVQVVSIEAQFQTKQVNALMRAKKESAPRR